ncbi:MAG: HAMP domain-containing histidine kinase [Gemmatimonadaceae bacterium]|nr:HAMP domain-containing histidine kinase [Gemmatimonadaceae bacterium]NUR20336.1 HAMP domain-containing histidine kinase [Gemmatimonadaceae bacterium]NUS98325.1 HAMP domain-containing histidine kinase [Gemmatimonadaceae bacterium]
MATDRSSQPLNVLRLRLTAWYAITFIVILLLLGVGLFVVVRRQITQQLRNSLHGATIQLARAARVRETESRTARGAVDAVEELRIPDRALYLLDSAGAPIKPDSAPQWVRDAARDASRSGETDAEISTGEEILHLHAERVRLASGRPVVAVAVASRVELEDQYADLIAAFAGAATIALVLVAGGGWLLARRSTEPAERTIEYMRRFMADAAHELRTPLAVLRSRAEVALQQERAPDAYVAALRAIDADSQRLAGIVDDLLTLARADAGERPVERRRLYLDDIALDAASGAQAIAAAKGVTVSVEEFEEAPVDGDEALVRQLVMILLDNAVKFTQPGGRVTIEVLSREARATLVVRDTGIGIPADQIGRIFERFYRGDPARTRLPGIAMRGGAGLGLSIARWIADAHDATIAIESPPNGGTVATVIFPPARDANDVSPQ